MHPTLEWETRNPNTYHTRISRTSAPTCGHVLLWVNSSWDCHPDADAESGERSHFEDQGTLNPLEDQHGCVCVWDSFHLTRSSNSKRLELVFVTSYKVVVSRHKKLSWSIFRVGNFSRISFPGIPVKNILFSPTATEPQKTVPQANDTKGKKLSYFPFFRSFPELHLGSFH